ncbi:MAG: hypothetical protein IPH57_15820 [Saprospiraceae bacterium]|nr:hypothetical protein [Saprospiraceae bacterium]
MKIAIKPSAFLFYSLISIIIFSCKSGRDSSGNLIKPDVISDFTQGTINTDAPIFVTFTKDADAELFDSEIETQDYFSLNPGTEGQLLWSGNRMLQFIPKSLQPNTKYTVELDLDRIFKNYKGKDKIFSFEFTTVPLHINVEFGELVAVSNDVYSLNGTISSNDSIPETDFKNILKLNMDGETSPEAEYNYLDKKTINFVISNIKRGNEEKTLSVSWEGKTIGSEDNGQTQFEIPAIGDFKFMNYAVKSSTPTIISLIFSDQLNRTQDIGSVVVTEKTEEKPKFIIRNNIIDLEFNNYLNGNFDVRIGKNLLNIENKKLDKEIVASIYITPPFPKLKLIDNGIITPNEGSINFAFEAINLRAVDIEIRKVYANNIMQFLHYNAMNSDYIPAEISDIVFQKKVNLAEPGTKIDMFKWKKYSIDLSKFIKTDKGAIYNVKVGFRKSYTDFQCEDDHDDLFSSTGLDKEPEQDEDNQKSIWQDWYWYSGYEWEHEKDPCYPLYYTTRNFIQKNILASNLGITAKSVNKNSVMVILNDLLTAQPVGNADIKCYTFSQQLIEEKSTDNNGIAVFDFKDKKPYFIIAKKGNDFAYIDLSEARSLSVSEFDIAGKKLNKGLDGYIYGERGVWRPGDSLFLNFVLKRSSTDLPADHPVQFELFDPLGKSYLKKVSSRPVGSIYNFNCRTNQNDPTGNWLAKVTIGNMVFTERIKIETVKPNRMKIKVDFRQKEKLSLNEEGKIDVKYLNGLSPSGSSATINLFLKKKETTFKSFESYVFDDLASNFSNTEQTVFEGPLDEEGNAEFKLNFDNKISYPGMLSAAFMVKAFEKSGEYSSDNFTKTISPYDEYVGIRFPKNNWGSEGLKSGEETKIPIIVLTKDGKPVANRKVTAMVYNAQWRWWWDDSDNYVANYLSDLSITPFKTLFATTDANGKAEIKLKVQDEGAYFLRVKDEKSGHGSGVLFYTGFFGGDDTDNKDFASKLKFDVDKEEYLAGEKAKISIPAGKGNRIFIAIEDSESIKKTIWQTSKTDVFTYNLDIEKWMFPYAYIHVSVFKPIRNKESDVPIRRYGIIPVKVTDPARKLLPVVNAPDIIKPNANYEIKVSEKNKRSMSYTLAIVDDGLLDLTRFKTPSPYDHFFAKFASTVSTWDVYNYIVQNEPGFFDKILSLGGDTDSSPSADGKKANRFKPVVTALGPFYLEKGKTATHKLKMQNYSGSVRVMVVASGDKDYGNAEKTIPVKSDLMMLLTAPRVLSPGEIFELPVTVFSTNKAIKNVDLTLINNNLFDLIGVKNTSLSFEKPGEKIAYMKLKVRDKEGTGTLELKASSGSFSANQKIEIKVENPNPFIKSVKSSSIKSGQKSVVNIEKIGTPGSNSAQIEFSVMPKLELESKIHYLLHYPYGCIEQTTSTAFPLVNLKNIMEMPPERADKINQIIIKTIDRLKSFQIKSGGFSYWPGGFEADNWGSVYAVHFLLEAKKQGYNTSPVLENGLNYLEKIAGSKLDTKEGFFITQRTYALMVLSKAGKPNRSGMNFIYNINSIPTVARWYLALAYAYSGNNEAANKLYAKGKNEIRDYTDVYYTYGTALRDYSVLLLLSQALNKPDASVDLARDIINRFKKSWYCTQETAYVLIALNDYISKNSKGLDFSVTVGGKTKAVKSQKSIYTLSYNEANMGEITVNNKNTNSPLFINVVSSGKAKQESGEDQSSNLNMKIAYTDKDNKAIDISNLKMGTEFKAIVTITGNNGIKDYRNMALNQVFPSGWEILNWRMSGAENKNTDINYQDIRDDRVYSFFNLYGSGTRIEIPLIATYPGYYYLPVQFSESMYDNTIFCRQKAGWVEVRR